MSDLIQGRQKDLGGFTVRRAIPTTRRRSVGPFVFFDHMGPVTIDRDHAMDVRPHPHIGLATVTYLFEGHGYHRDSIGSEQLISPGDINWMTAGRGIVHSERSPQEDRVAKTPRRLHGLQIWIGLPADQEECDPSFVHWPKESLPSVVISPNLTAKILLGEFGGKRSPAEVKSRTLYLDFELKENAQEIIAFDEKEIAFYLIEGRAEINEQILQPGDLYVLDNPGKIQFRAEAGSRIVAVGGDPFPEPRFMWWNFVSSKKERIREAAKAWDEQSMGKVPGEKEWIPLPKDPLP